MKKGCDSMREAKKILIVEDETLTAMMLEEYVMDRGYDSAGLCATGEEAVQTALEEKPDLVFMDFRLGGPMDGIAAAAIIEAQLGIPVVMMSGYAERAILERVTAYRPRTILQKPLSDADIDAVLAILD